MTHVQYTRSSGRRLTYLIRADDQGRFTVQLGDKELLRGRDRLSAGTRRCESNKRKAAGAVHEAKLAIESLSAMDET